MRLIPEGTVLLTSRAPIGKVAIAGTDMYCNQGFKNLHCSDVVYNKYLYWFLKGNNEYLNSLGRGATFKEISKSIVEDIRIPLPPQEVQIQIARELDAVSELLSLRKRQLEELDQLIKSQFVEMFGSEHEFSKRWDCTTVGDVANVTVGVVIKPAQYYTDDSNGIKAFRSLNIGEMTIRNDNWVYFSPEGHKLNSKSILKTGDVLVVRSGYPGTSCVVTEEYAGCNAIDIIIARPDSSKINSTYLCAFTNFPHGKNQIGVKIGGAAQQHFNVGAYKAMKIALPPINLQNKFADIVSQINVQKSLVRQAIDETQRLFDSLMSKYFDD